MIKSVCDTPVLLCFVAVVVVVVFLVLMLLFALFYLLFVDRPVRFGLAKPNTMPPKLVLISCKSCENDNFGIYAGRAVPTFGGVSMVGGCGTGTTGCRSRSGTSLYDVLWLLARLSALLQKR